MAYTSFRPMTLADPPQPPPGRILTLDERAELTPRSVCRAILVGPSGQPADGAMRTA